MLPPHNANRSAYRVFSGHPFARSSDKRKAEGKKVARDGLYYCRSCKGTFTSTTGTIYEDSHKQLARAYGRWLASRGIDSSSES